MQSILFRGSTPVLAGFGVGSVQTSYYVGKRQLLRALVSVTSKAKVIHTTAKLLQSESKFHYLAA